MITADEQDTSVDLHRRDLVQVSGEVLAEEHGEDARARSKHENVQLFV